MINVHLAICEVNYTTDEAGYGFEQLHVESF